MDHFHLIIVTGMSGAGKSHAVQVLEDIGSVEVARKLSAFRPFRAVYGNIDGAIINFTQNSHINFG